MKKNVLVPRAGALSKAFPALLQRAGENALFAASVRSRTEARGLSIPFVVRGCGQWASG